MFGFFDWFFMQLFDENTPIDLACRGFGQAEILNMTGVDTGYHTSKLRGATRGIDRMAYKVEHVRSRVSCDVIDDALSHYASCDLDADGVLAALGLANPTICKLHKLFKALDMQDAFKDADRQHRKNTMASGMVEKYGVDNPFKLDEFQEKAADTREELYGGRYTLSSDSVKSSEARRTFIEHMDDDEFRENLMARRRATCVERYGVESPMQNDEIKEKVKTTRGLSSYGLGHVELFPLNSVEDLYMRGWCWRDAVDDSDVEPVYAAGCYVPKVVTRAVYCSAHVVVRDYVSVLTQALIEYGASDMSIEDIFRRIGIRKANDISIVKVVTSLGLKSEWDIAKSEMRKRLSKKTADIWEKKYGVRNISQLESIKQRKRDTSMKHYGAESYLSSDAGKSHMRKVMQERYGVDNISQLDEIKAKKVATSLEHYGVEHTMLAPEVQEKIVESLRANYGVDDEDIKYPFQIASVRKKAADTLESRVGVRNPFELDEVQQQVRDTMQARYGVDNASKVDAFKAKRTETIRERYGVDNAFQSEELMEKARLTSLKRYGVEFPVQADVVKSKIRSTTFEHYGVECALQSPEVRKISRQTNLERYGVEYPMQSLEVQVRAQETNMRRYGVPHVLQSEEVKSKSCDTCMERYGVQYWVQSEQARIKIRSIMQERYGVDSALQLPEFKEKACNTTFERYGVENWMQIPENAKKAHDRIIENGSFGPSFAEESVFGLLMTVFGEDDVVYQYCDDVRYPFACDFYIKSRDLFIELNGTWSHGGHWFDESSKSDIAVRDMWQTKSTKYYDNAVDNWCRRDVVKRDTARVAELNYIVFWDGSENYADARLWFAMGCPDGRDWNHEYSWLPERELIVDFLWPKIIDTRASVASKVAKAANGFVFYKRELSLWQDNLYMPRWGTVQAWLYANRLRYLHSNAGKSDQWHGPTPAIITDKQLLRGFGVSGLLRAYTAFDNTAMVAVLDKYGIKSVLDPCAGWGERMATCIAKDVDYFGIDVNSALLDGYAQIVEHYGDSDKHKFVVGDSSQISFDCSADAVITCPPYGDIEVYSENGAENLDSDEFAVWWSNVVKNVGAHVKKYFCVQTNQAYKDVFRNGLEKHGWKFVESIELMKRSSHFTRGRGGVDRKREFEEMIVFKRA